MAIPASVLLYANWKSANLSGTTYTYTTPEKPNAFTGTFNANNTIVASGGSPWQVGQELVDLDNNFNCAITHTVSSSTIQATSGRIMFELAPTSVATVLVSIEAATPANGRMRVSRNGGGNLVVSTLCAGGDGNVDLGAMSSNPFVVEFIYDCNNATRSQRLRARQWDLGGTPGAFSDNTDVSSSASTTDQFTAFNFANNGD